jgi:ribosomal protein S18 acetylase RimI-like enzyme
VPPDAAAERDRALAFLRGVDERRAERVERVRGGMALAVFADTLPLVHDQNKAIAARGLGAADLPALVDAVEDVQAAGGLRHRKIAFEDEADGVAFAEWFRRRGWRMRPLRLMVHRGPAPAPDAVGPAVEVSPADLVGPAHAFAAEEPWGRSPEARRQVVAGDALTKLVVSERGFGVPTGRDGTIVAYCRLYSHDGSGQIENVTTLSAHRRNGYARALVSLALRESLAANELTFLVAEGADWPRHFYARMGFVDVGGYCEFNRLG